ncbi:MAG: hypothetical protein LBI44_07625 [Oscillospiraceae bacterium]|jgi:hypothetical protein|nr:hypothetical protein [Oscillospiraceae bacterium]
MVSVFSSDIEPSCSCCLHGDALDGPDVLCEKRGVVPVTGSCRRFAYDPLKRKPSRPGAPPVPAREELTL